MTIKTVDYNFPHPETPLDTQVGGASARLVDPLDTQVGGSHYKDMAIQPVTYIHANKLGFLEGNVVKYISRHAEKGGRQDIEKVIHYCQLLLQLQYGGTAEGVDTLVGASLVGSEAAPVYFTTEEIMNDLKNGVKAVINKRSIAAKKRWAKVKAKKAAFKRLASKVLSLGDKPKAKTKAKRK